MEELLHAFQWGEETEQRSGEMWAGIISLCNKIGYLCTDWTSESYDGRYIFIRFATYI